MQEPLSPEDKFKQLAGFFNAAAHELRTPVTTAKIYMQLLQELTQDDGSELVKQNLTKAETQLNRLNLLISNILDLSRIYNDKLFVDSEQVSVAEILKAVEPQARLIAVKHKFFIENDESYLLNGNKERIVQILLNLINNAVRFSPSGTEIILNISSVDNKVLFKVIDQGKGIPESMITEIFENLPDQNKQGLGISLYVSKRLAQLMNADISVESHSGEGAVFVLQTEKIS